MQQKYQNWSRSAQNHQPSGTVALLPDTHRLAFRGHGIRGGSGDPVPSRRRCHSTDLSQGVQRSHATEAQLPGHDGHEGSYGAKRTSCKTRGHKALRPTAGEHDHARSHSASNRHEVPQPGTAQITQGPHHQAQHRLGCVVGETDFLAVRKLSRIREACHIGVPHHTAPPGDHHPQEYRRVVPAQNQGHQRLRLPTPLLSTRGGGQGHRQRSAQHAAANRGNTVDQKMLADIRGQHRIIHTRGVHASSAQRKLAHSSHQAGEAARRYPLHLLHSHNDTDAHPLRIEEQKETVQWHTGNLRGIAPPHPQQPHALQNAGQGVGHQRPVAVARNTQMHRHILADGGTQEHHTNIAFSPSQGLLEIELESRKRIHKTYQHQQQ
mmetsp:Transcript_16467/g.36382  ORF Transcript_16467/g.36382 Transcript_16467/m.36382 type:complete len:379 (-) Transcript_16467:93-1229(-)